jgi:hypothetical protein
MSTIQTSAEQIPQVNFEFKRNQDTLRFLKFSLVINGVSTPIDIAERFANMRLDIRVRQSPDARRVVRYTFENGGLELFAADTLQINFGKFENVDGGVYWYDIFAEDNGRDRCLFQGVVKLENNSTL